MVREYLSNKNTIANTNFCPSNTPQSKLLNGTSSTKGLKVLPPIKPVSSSLERATVNNQGILYPSRKNTDGPTDNLNRVELFKKRDLRGGKRSKQTHVSIGKNT